MNRVKNIANGRSLRSVGLAVASIAAAVHPLASTPAGAQTVPEEWETGATAGLPLATKMGRAVLSVRILDVAGRSVPNADVDAWVIDEGGALQTVGRVTAGSDGRLTITDAALLPQDSRLTRDIGTPTTLNMAFVVSKDGAGLGVPTYRSFEWSHERQHYVVITDLLDPSGESASEEAAISVTPASQEATGLSAMSTPSSSLCIINGLPRAWSLISSTKLADEGQIVSTILHDSSSIWNTTTTYSTSGSTQARTGFALTRGVGVGGGSVTATDNGYTNIVKGVGLSASVSRAGSGASMNRKFVITTSRYRDNWGVQINGIWQSDCKGYTFRQSNWTKDFQEVNQDGSTWACPTANESIFAGGVTISRSLSSQKEVQNVWGWSGTLDAKSVSATLGVTKQFSSTSGATVSDSFYNPSTAAKRLCGVGGPNFTTQTGKVVARGL